ncbi:MAG: hypothetical protein HY290_22700 [Planctomycetia bacterium]|nr:hypothetical protein [Planctomycetia bacterium]
MLKRRLLVAAFALLVCAVGPATARAQDDEVVEDVPAAAAEVQQFMVADENFDTWVFGGRGTITENDRRFRKMLNVQIAGVERNCQLSEDQKNKLLLAGNADIKRFMARVDVLKKKFQLVKNDQNKFNEFWQDMQPVQSIVQRGTFGEGSYYRKTLKNLLTPEQVVTVDAAERERRMYHYRAKVEMIVCSLDDVLSLRAEQRRKLVELLAAGKQVPKSIGQESYFQIAILFRASQIPADSLSQVLDQPQAAALQRVLNQARGYGQFLQSNGFTWDEAPAGGQGAAVEIKANEIREGEAP